MAVTLPAFVAALLAGAAPDASDLMLRVEARDAFVERWSSAHVEVRYHPPVRSPLVDRERRPEARTRGFVVAASDRERPRVLAATEVLRGVDRVRIRFADDEEVSARVRMPDEPEDAPLVELEPTSPEVLEDRTALRWAAPAETTTEEDDEDEEGSDEDTRRERVRRRMQRRERRRDRASGDGDEEDEASEVLREGRHAWAIERPTSRGPDGERPAEVLVRTSIGPSAAHPLEAFHVVALRRARGTPLLDPRGRILCVAHHRVPGNEERALCAPRGAIAEGLATGSRAP